MSSVLTSETNNEDHPAKRQKLDSGSGIVRTSDREQQEVVRAVAVGRPLPKDGFETPFHGNEEYEYYGYGEASRAPGTRSPYFLSEIAMNGMRAVLCEKLEWWRKVQNPLIRFRWFCEMRAQISELSPKATAYAIQEIQYWAEQKAACVAAKKPFIQPTAVDGVYQSDDIVSTDLRSKLLAALAPLINVPDEKKDYHPNSDNQVVNLVHPSLYCYRIGESITTKEPFTLADTFAHCGSLSSAEAEAEEGLSASAQKAQSRGSMGYTFSDKYAWLPAEFDVDAATGATTIASYINNLHPVHHAALYPLLAETFSACVPLFERVLTDLVERPTHRLGDDYSYEDLPHEDTPAERVAWANWNRAEREARANATAGAAAEGMSVAAVGSTNSAPTVDASIPPYLLGCVQEPMIEAARWSTYKVLKQVHPDTDIDVDAMALLGHFQDGLAHMLLRENFAPTPMSVETAAAIAAPVAAVAAVTAKSNATVAAVATRDEHVKSTVENVSSMEDATEDEAVSKQSNHEDDEDDEKKDDEEEEEEEEEEADDEQKAAKKAAREAADAAAVAKNSANAELLASVGLEANLYPAIHAHLTELPKYAMTEAAKAITKYREKAAASDAALVGDFEQAAGLQFSASISKHMFMLFKTNVQRAAGKGDAAAAELLACLPESLTVEQSVSLAAQLEYFTAEVLELAGNASRDNRSSTIKPKYLRMAYEYDDELRPLVTSILAAWTANEAQRIQEEIEVALAKEAAERSSGGDDAAMAVDSVATAANLPVTYGGALASELKRHGQKFKMTEPGFKKENANNDEEEDEDGDEDGDGRGKLQHTDVTFPFAPPPAFDERPQEERISLRGRRLQVIVKLATIVLTPDAPKYDGGSWHVEGMENERIIASSIVYLESENLTESRLAFRQACGMTEPEQDDSRSGRELYGIDRDGECNQKLGSVLTIGGRAIAFPNIYQHRVQPFQLADATKPGHRTILVYFLCDPTKRIVSTATVPPQQHEWVKEYLGAVRRPVLMRETPLITPLVDMILDYEGIIEQTTITHDIAIAHRLELMEERSAFVIENSAQMFQREFSFCEH